MASSRMHRLSEFCKEHYLEVMLTMTVFGCSMLLTMLPAAKVAVLNLYFLPVVLAGFFLGARSCRGSGSAVGDYSSDAHLRGSERICSHEFSGDCQSHHHRLGRSPGANRNRRWDVER